MCLRCDVRCWKYRKHPKLKFIVPIFERERKMRQAEIFIRAACNCRTTQCYCSILIICYYIHSTSYIRGTFAVHRAFNLSQHSNQNDIICFLLVPLFGLLLCMLCMKYHKHAHTQHTFTHKCTNIYERTKHSEWSLDRLVLFYDGTLN